MTEGREGSINPEVINRGERLQDLKNKYDQITSDQYREVIYNFVLNLQNKYGRTECGKYKLFHLIAGGGSSITDEEAPLFDFEGEDSVERLIEQEFAKINPEKD